MDDVERYSLAEVESRLRRAFTAKDALVGVLVEDAHEDLPLTAEAPASQQDRRRRLLLWLVPVAGVCCTVALVAVVLYVMTTRPSPSQPSANTNQPTATGPGIEAALWRLSEHVASLSGTELESAQAVRTTARRAVLAVMNATDAQRGDEDVWVVQATARTTFDCGCQPGYRGKFIVLMVDPRRPNESFGGGVLHKPIDLTTLGKVIDLQG